MNVDRRVARILIGWQTATKECLMPLVFKVPFIERTFFWRFVSE